MDGWTITWEMGPGHKVRDMWNAKFTQTDNKVIVQDAGWNAKLPEKSTTYFGFIVDYSIQSNSIMNVTLNGFPCVAVTE